MCFIANKLLFDLQQSNRVLLFPDISEVPTKCVAVKQTLEVNANVLFIDFEGRSDGESIKKILAQIKPRSLVSYISGLSMKIHKSVYPFLLCKRHSHWLNHDNMGLYLPTNLKKLVFTAPRCVYGSQDESYDSYSQLGDVPSREYKIFFQIKRAKKKDNIVI